METVCLVIRSDGKYWHGTTEDAVTAGVLQSIVEERMTPMPPQFDMMCKQMAKMMVSDANA